MRRALAAPAFAGGAGLLLLWLAERRGAASWFFELDLGIVAIVLTALVAYLGRSPRAGEPAADETGDRHLLATVESLRARDLVGASAEARRLPGGMAAGFESALAALDVLANRIQRSSVDAAGEANVVRRISSELAAGSSEQAASVVEITAAMEELAQTASQIAANAAAEADLAARGEASGDAGAAAVERARGGVERVQERIASVAGRTTALERRAEEIVGVLALVEDIARETHLLSLNAAIEAAGETGEVGRSFTEIAEEVRRLAGRSRDAAGSVRRLLEDFSAAIRATAAATADGGREATRVLGLVRDSSRTLAELRGALAETSASEREISAGTQEQKVASAQVVQTLRESGSVVHQMADGLRAFAAAAAELDETTVGVHLLAQGFRLDSPSSLQHLAEEWREILRPLLADRAALEGRIEQLLARRADVECVYVFRPSDGRNVLLARPEMMGGAQIPEAVRDGRGFAERPWFRAVAAERRTILTPVFVSLLTNERVVTAASPFLAPGGELVAVLGVDINLERWTAG
ncbi:MAG: methyl-accepting chemotaxis protein [Thermoanaerobaculia bacterium]